MELFILLVFLPVGMGKLVVAQHLCNVGNSTHPSYSVSNCCNKYEVMHCVNERCLVARGCVPCEYKDGAIICWKLDAIGTASGPGAVGISEYQKKVIEWGAILLFGCDALGVGEACSSVILVVDYLALIVNEYHNFTCNATCALEDQALSTWSFFWSFLGNSWLGEIIKFLEHIPLSIMRAAMEGSPGLYFLSIAYFLTWQPGKLICLLAYIGAVYGAPSSQPIRRGCPPLGLKMYMGAFDDAYCLGIPNTEIKCNASWDGKGCTSLGAWFYNQQCTITNRKGEVNATRCGTTLNHTGNRTFCYGGGISTFFDGNFSTLGIRDSMTCYVSPTQEPKNFCATCIIDRRRKWCSYRNMTDIIQCVRDCTEESGDPKLTYDHCGMGTTATRRLTLDGDKHQHSFQAADVMLRGKRAKVRCPSDTTNLVQKGFLPHVMPGGPLLTSSDTVGVCNGFAFRLGDPAQGLVRVRGRSQYFKFSALGQPFIDHLMLIIALMFMSGARVLPLIYFLIYLQFFYVNAELSPGFGSLACVAAAAESEDLLTAALLVVLGLLTNTEHSTLSFVALCALKLASGYYAAFVLSAVLYSGLVGSVTGSSVCFEFDPVPSMNWDVSLAFALIFSYCILHLCSFTPWGYSQKLIFFSKVSYYHWRLRHWVRKSWLGINGLMQPLSPVWWTMHIVAILFPFYTTLCLVIILSVFFLIDCCMYAIQMFLTQKPRLDAAIALLDKIAALPDVVERVEALACWQKMTRKYHLAVFDHMGMLCSQTKSRLQDLVLSLDPVTVTAERLTTVYDIAKEYSCMDFYNGRPVTHRDGDLIRVGVDGSIVSANWTPTSPVRVIASQCSSWLSVVGSSLCGKANPVGEGHIIKLSTPLSVSLGFGFDGYMVTCAHSSCHRSVATPGGALSPLSVSDTDDIAIYPKIPGLQMLEPCTSGCTSGFLITKEAATIIVEKNPSREGYWNFLTVQSLFDIKGSSGGPLVCGEGKVLGVINAVSHYNSVASAVRVTPVSAVQSPNTVQLDRLDVPPEVPRSFAVHTFVAPTGSGKSTKLPMSYVNKGYKVLVLNPSVATVCAMEQYMADNYIAVNIMSGKRTALRNSDLTYCTYGKFLATPGLIEQYDIVICDECHSVDSTTVLGIAKVLHRAPRSTVKLCLLVTATPPGTQTTPHKDITEVPLGDVGIPFYGKNLDPTHYRSGRHLIFCHSKTNCHTLVDDFKQRGINAVYYYRGLSIDVIPNTGDVVVVATDALMTGYTGNFDSVTDCNVSVTEKLLIDLSPTFSVNLLTTPQDTVNRLQRRGRTGRGKAGIYRFVCPTTTPSGIVSDATVLAVYCDAAVWFHCDPVEVTQYLTTYNRTIGLPSISCELEMFQKIAQVLWRFKASPSVSQAATREISWPLLVGAQVEVCIECSAELPASGGCWATWRHPGDAQCPLLYNINTTTKNLNYLHPLVRELQACLGYKATTEVSAWLLVGTAAAASLALLHHTGSLVPSQFINVGTTGLTAVDAVKQYEEKQVLELTASTLDLGAIYEKCGQLYSKTRSAVHQATAGGAGTAWHEKIGALTFSRMLAGVQALAAIGCSGANPVLASLLAGSAGLSSHLPVELVTVISLLGGAVSSFITNPRSAACISLSGVIGAWLAGQGAVQIFLSLFTGYAACTTAASITFDLLAGEDISLARLAEGLTLILNPGSAVAGVVLAFALRAFCGREDKTWLNRFLAMNIKGSCLPENYFLDQKKALLELGRTLRTITPWALFSALTDWLSAPSETLCGCTLEPLVRFGAAVVRLLRRIRDWFYNIKICAIPILSCTPRWNGGWRGSGVIRTQCGCGNEIYAECESGLITMRKWTRRCCRVVMGGIPLGPSTVITGGAAPVPPPYGKFLYDLGLCEYIEVERRVDESIWLTGISCGSTTLATVLQCMESPPHFIDGVPVAPGFTAKYPDLPFTAGCIIEVGCAKLRMPLHLKQKRVNEVWTREENPTTNVFIDTLEVEPPKVGDTLIEGRHTELNSSSVFAFFGSQAQFGVEGEILVQKGNEGVVTFPFDDQLESICEDDRSLSPASSSGSTITMSDIPQLSPGAEVLATHFGVPRNQAGSLERLVSGEVSPSASNLVKELIRELGSRENPTFTTLSSHPSTVSLDTIGSAGWHTHEVGVNTDFSVGPKIFMEPPPSVLNVDSLEYFQEPNSSQCQTEVSFWTEDYSEDKLDCYVETVVEEYLSDSDTEYDNASTPTDYDNVSARSVSPPHFEGLEMKRLVGDVTHCNATIMDIASERASYVWTRAAAYVKNIPWLPVRFKTPRANRAKVYRTNPQDVGLRIKDVTRQRPKPLADQYLVNEYALARAKAASVVGNPLTDDELKVMINTKTARSRLSGITGSDVKNMTPRAREAVSAALQWLDDDLPHSYEFACTLMPKDEIFAKPKPPRIIAFPPLEVRCVEKIVLGNISPAVTKAIVGNYTLSPQERVEQMVREWKRRRRPAAFSLDAYAFDSQITQEDMEQELAIYQSAHTTPQNKVRIRKLHEKLYYQGILLDKENKPLGTRFCRASGVYTTSTSNTITSFIKTTAALKACGFKNTRLFVMGDDVAVFCDYVDDIDQRLDALRSKLMQYGLACAMSPVATSLEDLEWCSGVVSFFMHDGKKHFFLNRSPANPLARAIAETDSSNPPERWLGALMMHYPAPWAKKVLAIELLEDLWRSKTSDVTFTYLGNTIAIKPKQIPEILMMLHGKEIFHDILNTPRDVSVTSHFLSHFGLPSLRAYKIKASKLRVRFLRAGGEWATLANTLLAWASKHATPLRIAPEVIELHRKDKVWSQPPWMNQQYTGRVVSDYDVKRERLQQSMTFCGMVILLGITLTAFVV